ncbi:DMP19 family protein [Persicirhabdus sediminis]|uniref:DUF4375 domain-containing protein n=1 Tax=Persicirhabdus sediminis TaxID=454144 RepID=A0A8J7MC21_9BACT|nr:DUF4375 domain-containing protein [Persicirhabdus sediminis]MBK1789652.1 DUF4375 domain-containing protein [Persicirhabdus sediminis]
MNETAEMLIKEGFSFTANYVDERYIMSGCTVDDLDRVSKAVWLISWFLMDINGTGIDLYIVGAGGDHFPEFMNILDEIGAEGSRLKLASVCGIFPDGQFPESQEDREDIFYKFMEERPEEYELLTRDVDEFFSSGEEMLGTMYVEYIRRTIR